jgi:sulfite reductase alpha subunit-like flavoprotein
LNNLKVVFLLASTGFILCLGISLGPAWVFFGCHSPSAVLYEDEWPAFISDGIIARFYVSHSRVNPRKYVQDLLLETALEVVDLISNQGGNIYVCGDANGMAKGVKASLCEILGDAKIISNLQKEKRYFEDVW